MVPSGLRARREHDRVLPQSATALVAAFANGDKKLRAKAIALHTGPIKNEELPVILEEEEW